MKKILILTCFTLATLSWGSEKIIELDQAQEVKCHTEFKKLGCTNNAGEENATCIEAKKNKLSPGCKNIHQARK